MNPYIIAILSTFVWGLTFVSTKILLNAGLMPQEIALMRFIIAYLCLLAISKQPLVANNIKDEGMFALAGIFGGSMYFLTENIALQLSLASNVSIIMATAPLFVLLASHMFLKGERLTSRILLNSLLIFAGVALVILNGSYVLDLNPLGDLLALLASVSWAFYVIVVKKLGERYSSVTITRKVFFYGAVTLLPFMLILPSNGLVVKQIFTFEVVTHILFLSVFASFLCFIGWNYVTKKIDAMMLSNFIYIVPVVSLIASVLFLEEEITPLAILGLIFVIIGLYFNTNRREQRS